MSDTLRVMVVAWYVLTGMILAFMAAEIYERQGCEMGFGTKVLMTGAWAPIFTAVIIDSAAELGWREGKAKRLCP